MTAPTVKSLRRFFDKATADTLRSLMDGRKDPREFPGVQRWLDQCFNDPSDNELIMAAIDEVMDGHGVEAIRGRYVDGYHQDIQAVYVNMGDTYDITILLDHETGNYVLTTWGDWVERHGRTREIV